jgi:hypothetical protein
MIDKVKMFNGLFKLFIVELLKKWWRIIMLDIYLNLVGLYV